VRAACAQEVPVKLYSGPLSLFTAKVRIALDEKGIPYERIEVGWSLAKRYEPHHPDVVALNPKKQVPVLVDGDVVVYDSTLILEYLEERFPEPPLYPSELALRARCRQLEAAADEIVFPAVWELINGGFYPAAAGDTAAAERHGQAKGRVAELCEGLDKELAGREYLCGRFSVADIGTFIMLSTAATLGAPPPASCTQLQAWLARTSSRPAVRKELTAMAAHAAKARAGA
jgi:glutathione S-transferase